MVEGQVMEQVSQSLVLQTEREKLLSKLQDMDINNLTERKRKYCRKFVENFIRLSYLFFGLSKKQLSELSETEIKELAKLISQKARPWAICQMLFTFGIPIIGWIFGAEFYFDNGFSSWVYLNQISYFRRSPENDYFPFDILKKELK